MSRASAPHPLARAPARRARVRACLALLAALACASPPPPPVVPAWNELGSSAFTLEEDERALWLEAQQHLAEIEQEGQLVADPKLSLYLQGVLEALLPEQLPPAAPVPRVRVLRSVERNAAATSDGIVLVSTSYLAVLENEAQLAALFGHELAHFLARHALIEKRYAAVSASTVQRMKLSRAQEEAADALGLELMRKAGYDPREAIRMLALVERDDADAHGPIPQFDSHPFVPDRIRALRGKLASEGQSEGRREAERYDQAIADVLLVAAEAEIEAGLLERANAAITRHLGLRPQSGRGYYLKAEHERQVALEGRRSPNARRAYERAVELAPDDPDALRALGLLCREAGERERARELFGHYLRVAPDAADRKIIERYLVEDAAAERAPGREVSR